MPERGTIPAVLIDGPSAGQVIYTAPDVMAWYVSKPPEPPELSPPLNLANWLTPEPIVYRFEWRTACFAARGSSDPALLRLRFGWSGPGGLDDDAVRRYGRTALLEHPELMPPGAILWPADPADDEPIRILEPGDGPVPACQDVLRMDPRTRLVRGTCPCGWRTEAVESRRTGELMALTAAHGRAGVEALRAIIERGVVTPVGYAAAMGIARDDALAHALSRLDPAAQRRREPAAVGWGEPLTNADADWPAQGGTCAHVCGADPDHRCDARATVRLKYALPSGGTRSMPICAPCNASETAAKEHEHV